MANIIILEDQSLIAETLKYLVESTGKHCVKHIFNNINSALKHVKLYPQKVDLVIIDLKLKNESGLEFLEDLNKLPTVHIKTIILSQFLNPQLINEGFKLGVGSYLVKGSNTTELHEVIERVLNGEKFLHPSVSLMLKSEYYDYEGKSILSEKEIEVLALIGKCQLPDEICHKLNISHHTYKYHLKNIKLKLNLTTTQQLVAYSIEKGFNLK